MRLLFQFLFFWSIGIPGLVYFIWLGMSGDPRVIIETNSFFFIKYAPLITTISFAVPCILFPVLVKLGIISGNLADAEGYMKVKTKLVSGLLFLPGLIFFLISLLAIGRFNLGGYAFVAILLFLVISAIADFYKFKKSNLTGS